MNSWPGDLAQRAWLSAHYLHEHIVSFPCSGMDAKDGRAQNPKIHRQPAIFGGTCLVKDCWTKVEWQGTLSPGKCDMSEGCKMHTYSDAEMPLLQKSHAHHRKENLFQGSWNRWDKIRTALAPDLLLSLKLTCRQRHASYRTKCSISRRRALGNRTRVTGLTVLSRL